MEDKGLTLRHSPSLISDLLSDWPRMCLYWMCDCESSGSRHSDNRRCMGWNQGRETEWCLKQASQTARSLLLWHFCFDQRTMTRGRKNKAGDSWRVIARNFSFGKVSQTKELWRSVNLFHWYVRNKCTTNCMCYDCKPANHETTCQKMPSLTNKFGVVIVCCHRKTLFSRLSS